MRPGDQGAVNERIGQQTLSADVCGRGPIVARHEMLSLARVQGGTLRGTPMTFGSARRLPVYMAESQGFLIMGTASR